METFRRLFLLVPLFAVCLFCTGCNFSDANGGEAVPNNETGETDADPTIFKAAEPVAATATVSLPATVKGADGDAININATVRLPQLDEVPNYSKPGQIEDASKEYGPGVTSVVDDKGTRHYSNGLSISPPRVTNEEAMSLEQFRMLQAGLRAERDAREGTPRQKMGAAKPICNVYHNGDFGGTFGEWFSSNGYQSPADFPVEFKLIQGFPPGFEQACGFPYQVSPTFHWSTPRGYGRAYQGWFGSDKFAGLYYRDADQPYAAPKPGSASASTDGKGCNCGAECKCCPGCSCGGSHGPATADRSLPMSAACVGGSCRVQTRGGKKQ